MWVLDLEWMVEHHTERVWPDYQTGLAKKRPEGTRGLDMTWGWNPRCVITLGRHHCTHLLKDLAAATVLLAGGGRVMDQKVDSFFLIGVCRKEIWNGIGNEMEGKGNMKRKEKRSA